MEIVTTSISRPPITIIYGDHKIGKSTYGASCPNPVFIQTEDGLENLEVQAFPLCETFEDVLRHIEELRTEKHDFKTLNIDSLDWAERLNWQDICKAKGWEQIGDGPYGAGYKLALKNWARFVDAITRLNRERKMLINLIAHAKIVKFEDPERDNFDRYDLDLHEKSGNYLCQAVDIIGFANIKIVTNEKQEGFSKTVKGKSTGERILNLNKSAAFEAGNRYGLPDKIPLSWDALATEMKKVKKKHASRVQNLKAVKDSKQAADLKAVSETDDLPDSFKNLSN